MSYSLARLVGFEPTTFGLEVHRALNHMGGVIKQNSVFIQLAQAKPVCNLSLLIVQLYVHRHALFPFAIIVSPLPRIPQISSNSRSVIARILFTLFSASWRNGAIIDKRLIVETA